MERLKFTQLKIEPIFFIRDINWFIFFVFMLLAVKFGPVLVSAAHV